jgi:hypothetical protein
MSDMEILSGLDFDIRDVDLTAQEVGRMGLLDTLGDEMFGLELEFSAKAGKEARLVAIQERHAREITDSFIMERALTTVSEEDILRPGRALLPTDAPYRACVYRLCGKSNGQDQEIGGVRFISFASGSEVHFDVPVHVNGIPRVPFNGFHTDVIRTLGNELVAFKDDLSLSADLTRVVGPED